MNNIELGDVDGFELLNAGEAQVISSVYCADLLSWAMGNAPADSAWCTVMGNVNAVAVASLADVAVLVLCEGAPVMEDALVKAAENGVTLVRTALPAFEAGVAIGRRAGFFADENAK